MFEQICALARVLPDPPGDAEDCWAGSHQEVSASIPDGATLVELGSGASLKTRRLLDAAPGIATYAPIDVS